MESVPIISFGGSTFDDTICATKFAVRPMIAIMETKERPRTRTKVFARGAAPYSGIGILGDASRVVGGSECVIVGCRRCKYAGCIQCRSLPAGDRSDVLYVEKTK